MSLTAPDTPTAGYITGKTHMLPIRIYYEDTDAGGIVYHANYLRFAERGRTEMLRLLGVTQKILFAETGLAFAVYKADLSYMKPAKLDDVVLVETALLELSGASMKVRQTMWRGTEGGENEKLVQFDGQIVCMNTQGKAARIPALLRNAMAAYVTAEND